MPDGMCEHPDSQQFVDELNEVLRCGVCGLAWDEVTKMWVVLKEEAKPTADVEPEPFVSHYIPNDHDGKKDGSSDKQWVGKWFVAETGKDYYVPPNAGNYGSLHGKGGMCVEHMETSFGHSFAKIQFRDIDPDKVTDGFPVVLTPKYKLLVRWVRTSYLRSQEVNYVYKIVPVTIDKATDPVKEKFAGVWGTGNSGTEHITQKA